MFKLGTKISRGEQNEAKVLIASYLYVPKTNTTRAIG